MESDNKTYLFYKPITMGILGGGRACWARAEQPPAGRTPFKKFKMIISNMKTFDTTKRCVHMVETLLRDLEQQLKTTARVL